MDQQKALLSIVNSLELEYFAYGTTRLASPSSTLSKPPVSLKQRWFAFEEGMREAGIRVNEETSHLYIKAGDEKWKEKLQLALEKSRPILLKSETGYRAADRICGGLRIQMNLLNIRGSQVNFSPAKPSACFEARGFVVTRWCQVWMVPRLTRSIGFLYQRMLGRSSPQYRLDRQRRREVGRVVSSLLAVKGSDRLISIRQE